MTVTSIATTFESLIKKDEFISSLISIENLKEIIATIKKEIKYLTNYTIIFLEEINGRWYINWLDGLHCSSMIFCIAD